MRGMTKKYCLAIEKMVIAEISKVCGQPVERHGHLEWKMPYNGGEVSMHLFCDSKRDSNPNKDGVRPYRNSWLACRFHDKSMINVFGYTKPRDQIEWPFIFSYPSGKYNLYFHPTEFEEAKRDLAWHLIAIAAPDSREKEAFREIRFEV